MRYFIKPQTGVALSWLLDMDPTPSTLPTFKDADDCGLVVAQLISGKVLAEVLPTETQVKVACGSGVPLGRLYFRVPKIELYPVCPDLKPETFGGQ
jgi:hypothetical protein